MKALGPEIGVASLTDILLVRHFQRPDSRRGNLRHHLWSGGVSKNLGATFKDRNTTFFECEVHSMNSLI